MKLLTYSLTLATALTLAACNGQPDAVNEAEEVSVEPTPSREEPVSILRPDVEQPQVEPPAALQPLPLNATIGFPKGGIELDAQALAALRQVIETEPLASGAPITLRGHSDAGGNYMVNQRVSHQRAEAVRDWLVDNGVDEGRISVIAFGEQNPVAPNALPDGSPNEAGRAANRRVEIHINPATDNTKPATPLPQPGN